MTISLVCLSGLMCTPDVWDDVLAVGSFPSSVEVLAPVPAALDSIERSAEEVLRRSPERFVLAGHSMGGYVALEALRAAPERVSGLLLLSSSARADTEDQRAGRRQAVDKARRVGMGDFVTGIARFLLGPDAAASPALLDRIVRMAEAVGFDTFALHQQATAMRRDNRALLPSVRCPTAVIVGDADRITPPALAEEIASGIPGAKLHAVARAGHMTLLEAPDMVAEVLRRLIRAVSQAEPALGQGAHPVPSRPEQETPNA